MLRRVDAALFGESVWVQPAGWILDVREDDGKLYGLLIGPGAEIPLSDPESQGKHFHFQDRCECGR